MKLLLWVVLMVGSFYVNASNGFIPFEVVGDYQDAGIQIEVNNIHNLAMVKLENTSSNQLRCEGVFHSGPEPDVIRKAVLKSAGEKTMSAKFFRHVIKLKITLDCEKVS